MILIYMNRFMKHWRLVGRGEAFCAHAITYADDSLPSIQSNQVGTHTVGKLEGDDSVRRQNIDEMAGVALWSLVPEGQLQQALRRYPRCPFG